MKIASYIKVAISFFLKGNSSPTVACVFYNYPAKTVNKSDHRSGRPEGGWGVGTPRIDSNVSPRQTTDPSSWLEIHSPTIGNLTKNRVLPIAIRASLLVFNRTKELNKLL